MNGVRNSSIELLRIIAMIVIITAHCCGHGSLLMYSSHPVIVTCDNYSWQIVFSELLLWGGTLGNSIFLLITGYFMIDKEVNYKKLLTLFIVMLIYSWAIGVISVGFDLVSLSYKQILKIILPFAFGENWYVSCYIMFSFFIPYINSFLKNISNKEYNKLLIIFFVLFFLIPTFGGITYMNNASFLFFVFFYSVGGLVKRKGALCSCKKAKLGAMLLIGVAFFTILLMNFIGVVLHNETLLKPRIVTQFTEIIIVPLSICLFICFLKRKPFYNKTINYWSGSVLGIYLIHDNFIIREIIWQKVFPNIDELTSMYYPIFVMVKVTFVFLICGLLDMLRRKYLNKIIDRIVLKLNFEKCIEYGRGKYEKFSSWCSY